MASKLGLGDAREQDAAQVDGRPRHRRQQGITTPVGTKMPVTGPIPTPATMHALISMAKMRW